MRYLYLFALLLAGCTASNWTKQGGTSADMDRDYEECRVIAKPDPAIAAAFGAFGAIGVFVGVNTTDSKIRSCMVGRGWDNNTAERTEQSTGLDTRASSGPELKTTGVVAVSASGMPPAPTSTVNTSPASNDAARLKKLKELRDAGLITDAEYEKKKAEILSGM